MADVTIGEAVRALGQAVADVVAADVDCATKPELADLLVALSGIESQLAAVTARVAARVDASKIWANDGSRSSAAWLSRAAGRDRNECADLLRRGRALREMPLVDEAHRAGRLSARHVQLLAQAARWAPDCFADDESWLVARALELPYDDMVKVVAYWRQCTRPDDIEDDAARRWRQRSVHLSPGLDGVGHLDVTFEPIGYAEFSGALRRIEQELWEADWAEARERLGDGASTADLARSAAQRRYDALLEMSRRASAVPPGAKAPRPLVTVHVDHETLTGRICELSTGQVVTPGEVLPLLVEADIERAVFGPGSRVIDLGRRSRLFVGGSRRAVEIQQPTCTHGTCGVPSELCDIHHIEEWAHGGTTDPGNGEPRCPPHHPGRRRKNPPRRRRRRSRGQRASRSDDEDGPFTDPT